MKRVAACVLLLAFFCSMAKGQGIISDVFSGKLVNPKAGAWARYSVTKGKAEPGRWDLVGTIRLAIVGEEKVGDKPGYWLETEYVPSVGDPSVCKMLLTGPANDPANVHKVFRREGLEKKQQLPIKPEGDDKKGRSAPPEGKKDDSAVAPPKPAKEPDGKLVVGEGESVFRIVSGVIVAQHYEAKNGDKKIDLYMNESVCPMGIVRLESEDGNLLLDDYGTGGPGARSVIDDPPPAAGKNAKESVKVDVRVEKEPKRTTPAKPSKGRP